MLVPPSFRAEPAARSSWPDSPVTVTRVPCCCHVPFQPDRFCWPAARSKLSVQCCRPVAPVLVTDSDTDAPLSQGSFTWYPTLHDSAGGASGPDGAAPSPPTGAPGATAGRG